MIRTKPTSCSGCPLQPHGRDFSAVEGTGANGVLLVGEASGEHEQREQLPFRPYAPAGAVLERCLRRMGLDRKQFAITNVIRCRPRKNWLEGAPWEYSAIRQCRTNLDAVIQQYRPRCIVALGGIALRELTGEAGEARGVTHLAGYVLPLAAKIKRPCEDCGSKDPACFLCGGEMVEDRGIGEIPVLANFHPAYLRRGKASHQGVFSRILQRALAIAAGRDRQFAWGIKPDEPNTWNISGEPLRYWTNPTLDQTWSVYHYLRDNSGLAIARDIETSESTSLDEDAREGFMDTEVRLFQLSYQPGTGIAIPYVNGFKGVVQRILALPNRSYGHNWNTFDHKVLRACAAREGWKYAPTSTVLDTLDMFHHWQPDLPAHLQFCSSFINFPFPWKHLAGTDIEFYGCCDVDADLRLGGFLEAALSKEALWDGYVSQYQELRPVLAAMEDRGMPIDDARRQELGRDFDIAQRKLGAEIAERAPEACRRVHPKEGYKGVPPDVKKIINIESWDKPWGYDDVSAVRFQDPKPVEGREAEWDGEWYTYQRRTFDLPNADLTTTPTERWCRVYDFNPNSSQQLLAYMKAMKHKVPKSKQEDADGNQKDTTAAKELQRLAVKTGDDFYLKVIEYRGLTKARGTYIDGFRPDKNGYVHTTFTFATAIGQLSSRNVNLQNFTKLKPTPELATALRSMVKAKEGMMLTEIDFKSCHVITLGLLAGDENYTRLGRLDIHSAVAGHFLGLWNLNEIIKETDDELMRRFKWLKSDPERKRVRDDQAKHGILGIGNGLRAKGLYERYMESFPPRSCPVCSGSGKVAGLRGLKNCGACKGTAKQSGLQIAEAVLSTCESLFPKVFAYQEAQRREAHERMKLSTPWGHQRRFYEVYRWDNKRGDWGHGDQAEEAVAYRLASSAHAHMREVMKELHYRKLATLNLSTAPRLVECDPSEGMAFKYGMFNQIHDSLMFHHREELKDEILMDVVPVMQAESKVLPGLWLGVEASQGRRWSEMKTVEVPTFQGVV